MKIKGIELKAIKWFKDHEGMQIPYGNIYFNGKKVGNFSDDYMCGPMEINVEDKDMETNMNNVAMEYYNEHPYGIKDVENFKMYDLKTLYEEYPLEGIINEITSMYCIEKDYKAMHKDGFQYVIWSKDNPRAWEIYAVGYANEADYKKKLKSIKKDCLVYNATSLNDFIFD